MRNSFLAFVLLESPAAPVMAALAAALRTRHPELATEMHASDAGIRQGSAGASVLRCGDQLITVMSMPTPIPGDLWSRATPAWPEASTVAARHSGHLMVSVLGQNQQLLPTARLMTAAIGALTMPECCAVVWDGKAARPADLWLHLSM